jgi:hypothetical protein
MRIDDDDDEEVKKEFNYFACHIYDKESSTGGPTKYGHACKEGNNKQHHFDALACVFCLPTCEASFLQLKFTHIGVKFLVMRFVCPLAKLPFFNSSSLT